MQELELNSARLLRLWWAFVWRFAALFATLTGTVIIAALLVGFTFIYALGVQEFKTSELCAHLLLASWLVGIPSLGLAAIRLTLGKPLGHFRLALLTCEPKGKRPEPDTSLAETVAG